MEFFPTFIASSILIGIASALFVIGWLITGKVRKHRGCGYRPDEQNPDKQNPGKNPCENKKNCDICGK